MERYLPSGTLPVQLKVCRLFIHVALLVAVCACFITLHLLRSKLPDNLLGKTAALPGLANKAAIGQASCSFHCQTLVQEGVAHDPVSKTVFQILCSPDSEAGISASSAQQRKVKVKRSWKEAEQQQPGNH